MSGQNFPPGPNSPYIGGPQGSFPQPQPKKRSPLKLGCGCLGIGLLVLILIGAIGAALGGKKDDKPSQAVSSSTTTSSTSTRTPSTSSPTSVASVSSSTTVATATATSSTSSAQSATSSSPTTTSAPATPMESESSPSEASSSEAASSTSVTPTSSTSESASGEVGAATQAARNYLDTMPFSKRGLIEQLSSPAGDQYPVSVATAAVNSLTDVNWNEQAAKSAKSYLETMPMSCAALKDQLSSEYGEKFTRAQAVYGASKTSVCK